MANKFSIKKLAAGVLALLMVVTALPVSGLTASVSKAAESDTTPVYVLYDANRGEHFFTANESEKDGLLAIGWKEGNVAWMSPKTSKTPVYVLYNPNDGGDHYYTANEKEKDSLLAIGWTEGNVKFYSDDDKGVLINTLYNPNEIARNHHYTASTNEKTSLIALGWQDHTNADTAIYGVKDFSADVKITDKNGFQTDGTALPTDLLELSYGSSLGTPDTIIWYLDGAAKGVYTAKGGTISTGFSNAEFIGGGTNTISSEMATGKWYVTIENTEGKTFVSNTVVVANQDRAVLYDFEVIDDYETAAMAGLSVAATDAKAVISFKMNKDYPGTIYVYNDSNVSYNSSVGTSAGNAIAILDLTTDAVKDAATASKTYVDVKTSLSKMTAANAIAAETASAGVDNASTAATNNGMGSAIKYVDKETGEVTIMFQPDVHDKTKNLQSTPKSPVSLTRGNSYKIVFDQENIEDDDIGTTARDDVEVSESFEAPYLEEPAAIVAGSFKKGGTTAGIGFINAQGEVMEWITHAAAAAAAYGFESVNLYNIDDNVIRESDAAVTLATTPLAAEDGGMMVTIDTTGTPPATLSKEYLYAKVKTTAGVYGPKSITLTSEVIESAINPATNITMTESTTEASTAVVTLTGHKSAAPGTVYIYHAKQSSDGDYAHMSQYSTADAVGSAHIEGGVSKVEIEDVFSASHLNVSTNTDNNDFIASFVPDDTDLWSTIWGGNATTSVIGTPTVYTLSQQIVSFAMAKSVVSVGATSSDLDGTNVIIKGINQFGNDIDTSSTPLTNLTFVTKDATAMSSTNANIVAGVGTVTISAGNLKNDGKVDIDGGFSVGTAASPKQAGYVAGTSVSVDLPTGQKLIITCTKTGTTANGTENTDALFTVTIE